MEEFQVIKEEELNWGPLDFSSCALKPMGHANKYSSSVKSVNNYMWL